MRIGLIQRVVNTADEFKVFGSIDGPTVMAVIDWTGNVQKSKTFFLAPNKRGHVLSFALEFGLPKGGVQHLKRHDLCSGSIGIGPAMHVRHVIEILHVIQIGPNTLARFHGSQKRTVGGHSNHNICIVHFCGTMVARQNIVLGTPEKAHIGLLLCPLNNDIVSFQHRGCDHHSIHARSSCCSFDNVTQHGSATNFFESLSGQSGGTHSCLNNRNHSRGAHRISPATESIVSITKLTSSSLIRGKIGMEIARAEKSSALGHADGSCPRS